MGLGASKPRHRSSLAVGDLILFKETGGEEPYMLKASGWKGYTFPAFVSDVQDTSVTVCGCFDKNPDAPCAIRDLEEELNSGRYAVCYIRRLCQALTEEQVERVQSSLDLLVCDRPSETVCILMTSPQTYSSINCISPLLANPVDRLFTSRMIAEMLHLVNRVEEVVSSPLTFCATSPGGLVLRSAVQIYTQRPGTWGLTASVKSVRNLMQHVALASRRGIPAPDQHGDGEVGAKSSYFSMGSVVQSVVPSPAESQVNSPRPGTPVAAPAILPALALA